MLQQFSPQLEHGMLVCPMQAPGSNLLPIWCLQLSRHSIHAAIANHWQRPRVRLMCSGPAGSFSSPCTEPRQ